MHLVALVLHWLQSYFDLLHCAMSEESQVLSPGGGGGGGGEGDYPDSGVLIQDCELGRWEVEGGF